MLEKAFDEISLGDLQALLEARISALARVIQQHQVSIAEEGLAASLLADLGDC